MGQKEENKHKGIVTFEALTLSSVDTYIDVGIRSYRQHYLHLWQNENLDSFLKNSLSKTAV
ncbi:MAG: hypothetical protein AAGB24_08165 [Bacteroidota bacterium]